MLLTSLFGARPRGDRGRRPAAVHLRLARRERGQPRAVRRRLRRRRADRQQLADDELPQRRGHPRRGQPGRRRHPGRRRARRGRRAAATRARPRGTGRGRRGAARLGRRRGGVGRRPGPRAGRRRDLADWGRRSPGAQIAVLARKRSHFARLEAALRDRGVPCEVVGLGGLLTRPEVVDVVCVLRVLADPARRWRAAAAARPGRGGGSGRATSTRSAGGPGTSRCRPAGCRPGCAADDRRRARLRRGRRAQPGRRARRPGPGHGVLRGRPRPAGPAARRAAPAPALDVVVAARPGDDGRAGALDLDVELASRPGVRPVDALLDVDRFVEVAEDFVGVGGGPGAGRLPRLPRRGAWTRSAGSRSTWPSPTASGCS